MRDADVFRRFWEHPATKAAIEAESRAQMERAFTLSPLEQLIHDAAFEPKDGDTQDA